MLYYNTTVSDTIKISFIVIQHFLIKPVFI